MMWKETWLLNEVAVSLVIIEACSEDGLNLDK